MCNNPESEFYGKTINEDVFCSVEQGKCCMDFNTQFDARNENDPRGRGDALDYAYDDLDDDYGQYPTNKQKQNFTADNNYNVVACAGCGSKFKLPFKLRFDSQVKKNHFCDTCTRLIEQKRCVLCTEVTLNPSKSGKCINCEHQN